MMDKYSSPGFASIPWSSGCLQMVDLYASEMNDKAGLRSAPNGSTIIR